MSTFSNNPRLLTKDELKSELKANGIPLPRAEQRKAYYVDLYLERLTSQNQNEEFSSDEEEMSKYSPMRASQKLPVKLPKKVVINKRVKGDLPFDVAALSDGDLARQLKSFGATVGPITESTRPLYQKKLAKLLTEEKSNPVIPVVPKVSPKKPKASPVKPSNEYVEFSDDNEVSSEERDVEEVEEVEEVEPLPYELDGEDQQDTTPKRFSHPKSSSTPSKATLTKRVPPSMTMATQQTQQILTKDSENNLSKEHPMETVAKKKTPEPNKEEHSICGPHIQILLAVGVFLAFTAFLVYHLMEDNPYKEIGKEGS